MGASRQRSTLGVRPGPAPRKSPGRALSANFVYILTCSDATFYAGYTTDPERRVKEHNAGTASRYTRARLPVRLSFLEGLPSRSAALRREFQLKKLSRLEKMRLCRDYAARRIPSSR